jgi:hypothetical protein
MTVEKKLTAEAKDVRAIVVICKTCGFSQGFNPKSWNGALPHCCPNCPGSRNWPQTPSREHVEALGKILVKLAEEDQSSPFEVRLQFDAD